MLDKQNTDNNKFEENREHIVDDKVKEKNDYQDILSTEDCILDAFDLDDPDRIGN